MVRIAKVANVLIPHADTVSGARITKGKLAMTAKSATIVLSELQSPRADLNKLLADLQDPKLPNFHAWPTHREFGDRRPSVFFQGRRHPIQSLGGGKTQCDS